MNRALISITGVSVAFIVAACSGSLTPSGPGAGGDNGALTGGTGTVGGTNAGATGGVTGMGGTNAGATGGTNAGATGGTNVGATGGTNASPTGGAPSTGPTGGRAATGGTNANPTGGSNASPTGGTNASTTGGKTGTGGSNSGPTGGSSPGTGGKTGTGGSNSGTTGGTPSTGGNAPTGGASSTGGSSGTSTGVTVQLGQTDQTIEGFGINDTWNALTSSQATALFSATSGIGMTILRVGMSSTGDFYNSGEAGNISAAKSAGATKIIGSVWTAPAADKDNNSLTGGGHLKSANYTSWATSIANWASSNSLYAMSIANEPDFASCGTNDPCNGNYDTMLYTASEMVAFVKVAGPLLQAKGVKVIAPEASEWNHLWSNVSAGPDPGGHNSSDPLKCGCFGMGLTSTTTCASTCSTGGGYDYGHYLAADTTAWGDLDIIGVHEYDSQTAFAWPSDVTSGKPSKEVWMTEMSGVKWWPEQGPSSDINDGIVVAGWIHSALVTGNASAWLWWWYSPLSSGTNDNEGIVLQNGTDTKRHYTIGNYSKFVRPGYTRVEVTGNSNANLLLSAYKGTDGTVVVVAINNGTSSVTVPISISGGTAPASCTPNVTSASANLTAGSPVTVTGGSFTATLAATTVTSFVCK